MLVGFLTMLLASCSAVSENDLQFSLAPGAGMQSASSDFDRPTTNSLAGAADDETSHGSLPATMTVLPVPRPGREVVATPPPAEVEAAAADRGRGTAAKQTEDTAQADTGHPEMAATAQEPDEAGTTAARHQSEAESAAQASGTSEESGAPRSFLSAFFSPSPTNSVPQPSRGAAEPPHAEQPQARQQEARPLVALASTAPAGGQPAAQRALISGEDALPGVRQQALFQISRRSGLDDDSDIDIYEMPGSYQVASAAPGMARLAPNGLLKQTPHVDVNCLQPALVRKLNAIERHFRQRVMVTSGYRSPDQNRRARGARNSLHMYCAAADIQVEGVSKWDLAAFVRSMQGRGGVGTYCHTESVHVDIGPERDWNWRCRRRN